jgi:hypothetical protein
MVPKGPPLDSFPVTGSGRIHGLQIDRMGIPTIIEEKRIFA